MQRKSSTYLRPLFLLALVAYLGGALAAAPADAAGSWAWPVRGELVTAYRNGADPYAAGQHRGIDVAATVGTPVVAATPGTVTFAGGAGTAGLTVAVRTADGRFDTSYLHLSSIDVNAGEPVAAGARLGAVGLTGRRSLAASHLHFGVRDAGSRHAYRDPLEFLGSPVPPGPPLAVPLLAAPRSAPRVAGEGSPAASIVPSAAAPPLVAPSAHALQTGESRQLPRLATGPAPGPAVASERRSAPGAPASRPAPGNAVAPGAHQTSPSPSNRPAVPGPDLGAAPAGAVESGRAPVPGGDRRPRAAAPASDGARDLGRTVALLGLVAAAALAARPAERRAVAQRGRLALGAVLRPLLSRH